MAVNHRVAGSSPAWGAILKAVFPISLRRYGLFLLKAKGSEMGKNRHFSAIENGYNRNRDYIDYHFQIEGLIPIGIILTALGIRTPNHRTC